MSRLKRPPEARPFLRTQWCSPRRDSRTDAGIESATDRVRQGPTGVGLFVTAAIEEDVHEVDETGPAGPVASGSAELRTRWGNSSCSRRLPTIGRAHHVPHVSLSTTRLRATPSDYRRSNVRDDQPARHRCSNWMHSGRPDERDSSPQIVETTPGWQTAETRSHAGAPGRRSFRFLAVVLVTSPPLSIRGCSVRGDSASRRPDTFGKTR